MRCLSGYLVGFLLGLAPLLAPGQTDATDSLQRQIQAIQDQQARYALPTVPCPLRIDFPGIDPAQGVPHIEIFGPDRRLKQTFDLYNSQYGFILFAACGWKPGRYRYVIRRNGEVLHKGRFEILGPQSQ